MPVLNIYHPQSPGSSFWEAARDGDQMKSIKRSLLLVEDSADDEALSLRAISQCGVPCEVEVVRHGGEALGMLLSPLGPKPDLVVLDFHLPGFNGLEILRQLRKNERTRHVPIVMLSSLQSSQEVSDCLAEGARSFVRKPDKAQAYYDQVGLIIRYWLTVDEPPQQD
jgi:CheY-like chemotaxis protein